MAFTPPNGEVGAVYIAQPTASGGTGSHTWAVTAGPLPTGLSIDASTGAITGTPTAAGSFNVTVQATDAIGGFAYQAGTITIVAAPTLTFAAPPAAELGAAYSNQLTKSGGIEPFTWTVSVGSPPDGLTLASDTGLLAGTPTAIGTSAFTVRVVDANGLADIREATIVVNKTTSTVSVSAPASVRFGTTVTLTAAVGPSSAGGTVTFMNVPATGPQAGSTVTLGIATVTSGVATLTITLPNFGANKITTSYGGDGTHTAVTSSVVTVEVAAYLGEVIVTEFRTSGPDDVDDSYIEIYNTGPTVPMGGFRVTLSSGSDLALSPFALPTGRSFLMVGDNYTLYPIASTDMYGLSGTGGIKVSAPDTAGTQTDAVGPATQFHRGTALPVITGTSSAQHAWVRLGVAGRPKDTGDNAADFTLVSDTGGVVGGVQSTLGSPSPTGLTSPFQHNAFLQSTLLDPSVTNALPPNRVSVSAAGSLVIRRTITNSSGVTITEAKVRMTALSEANGAPLPGVAVQPASHANLRVVNPVTATSVVPTPGRGPVTVQNLSVDSPIVGAGGGGLNSTLTVPLPPGGLPSGSSVDVAFTFQADTGGTFWFGYDVDAR